MPTDPRTLAWPTAEVEQRAVAEAAAAVLRAGGLVVYPTDTVYGLGADAWNSAAMRRIYEVKGRPDQKAIIWLVDEARSASRWCEMSRGVEQLAERFWPGALTLVLRRLEPTAGDLPALGVRVPAHPAALAIIKAAGGAVATTSANASGAPSARTAGEARAQIGAGVDLIIDAGPAPGGTESTVIDMTVDPPKLLRAGAISVEDIEEALGVSLEW